MKYNLNYSVGVFGVLRRSKPSRTSTKATCNAYLRMLALKNLKKLLKRRLSSEEQGACSLLLYPPNECNVTALNCLHTLLYLNYECSNDMVLGIKDDKMLFYIGRALELVNQV